MPTTTTPKIFCTGLSRTGTTSLNDGLEALGLRAIHFPLALFGRSEDFNAQPFRPLLKHGLWGSWQLRRELKALRLHSPLDLFDQYDAFSDLPVPLFYKNLDRYFPGSKFIHTTRDLNDWLASMQWLFDQGLEERNWTRGEIGNELHFAQYHCYQYDEEKLTQAFHRHEQDVQDYFSGREEQLLVLNISKGELDYQKIAPFLGKEVPDTPFPTSNKKS